MEITGGHKDSVMFDSAVSYTAACNAKSWILFVESCSAKADIEGNPMQMNETSLRKPG